MVLTYLLLAVIVYQLFLLNGIVKLVFAPQAGACFQALPLDYVNMVLVTALDGKVIVKYTAVLLALILCCPCLTFMIFRDLRREQEFGAAAGRD